MNPEDLKLLNDIALIDQQLQIRTSDSVSNVRETLDSVLEANEDKEESQSPEPVDQTPRDLNLSCQKVLRDIESKLVEKLEENLDKQKTIMKYLKESNRKTESAEESIMNGLIRCAGIPYFKDFYGYPQPRNEVVKDKLANGELLSVDYLTGSSVWSKHDKKCLTKAVLNSVEKSCGSVKVDKPIDWLKISATDMNGKYSANECEAQWKLHLSPDVNKRKWTAGEIKSLNIIAKKYKYQDWDSIAEELNTNRSGYQCCIQYQTKNSLEEGKWTAEEDAYLEELIDKFKRNDQIPWTKISWFFQTRSRKQCQDRYLEHLRKDLKRGLFSAAEDKIIISGANIFKDFGKLAKFLPGRAPTQIRSRYYYLIGTAMTEFTEDEDKLLLSLVKKHSNNWLAISQNFPDRSNLQCRQRYAALCREKDKDAIPDLWMDIQDCKKATRKAPDVTKKKKPEKAKQKTKSKTDECDVYSELISYHENCSEYYFGPRLRNPASEAELSEAALKLRATMAMLSVSCDLSGKTEMIESLKHNCNFDSYDIKLLNKLAEEDASAGSTLKDNYHLRGMLIPPNRGTLTGYQTISSSRARIKFRTCEAEGLPKTSSVRHAEENRERLSISKAKALFKSRMMSMFLIPSILSKIDTDNLSQEVYRKGKTKKPKKMTKKRLRNHARAMNAAYREKRRKLAEGEAATSQQPTSDTDESATADLPEATPMECEDS